MERTVNTATGSSYVLSPQALYELQQCRIGDSDCIFDRFAPHVPKQDRLDVWVASLGDYTTSKTGLTFGTGRH